MRVDLTATITVVQTRALKVRQGTESIDMKTVGKLLESMTDDKPLIIETYGTKEDRLPGDYFMRECRGIFIFKGCKYKALEKNRQREEKEGRKQAARQLKLDKIKNELRARPKVENEKFDKKYDVQSREQAETTERRIEREALAILAKEEGADKC